MKILKRFVQIIFAFLIPIQSLNYYNHYFTYFPNKTKRQLCQITVSMLLVLYQSLRHIYLMIYSVSLSDFELLLLYDPNYIAIYNNVFNIVWFLAGIITCKYFQMTYFNMDCKILTMLKQLMTCKINANNQSAKLKETSHFKRIQKVALILPNIFLIPIILSRKYMFGILNFT